MFSQSSVRFTECDWYMFEIYLSQIWQYTEPFLSAVYKSGWLCQVPIVGVPLDPTTILTKPFLNNEYGDKTPPGWVHDPVVSIFPKNNSLLPLGYIPRPRIVTGPAVNSTVALFWWQHLTVEHKYVMHIPYSYIMLRNPGMNEHRARNL